MQIPIKDRKKMLALLREVGEAIDREMLRQYLDGAQAAPDFDLAAAAAINQLLVWLDREDNTPTEKVH